MKRFLIVNADGFGFTPGVSKGIAESIEKGIVKSTSCVVNFGNEEEFETYRKTLSKVSVGIHFNLTVGKPISPVDEIPSLVNKNGFFWGEKFPQKVFLKKIEKGEVEKELLKQANILTRNGYKISHWDGHQNQHLYPVFFKSAIKVAKEIGIPCMRTHNRLLVASNFSGNGIYYLARYYFKNPRRFFTHSFSRFLMVYAKQNGMLMADRLITPGYLDHSSKNQIETWELVLNKIPLGINEIYCHPGYPDEILRENAYYVDQRKHELEILTSKKIKELVEINNIRLINFWGIVNNPKSYSAKNEKT